MHIYFAEIIGSFEMMSLKTEFENTGKLNFKEIGSLFAVNTASGGDLEALVVGNKIVDHLGVVGASPVGAVPTTSLFST